MGPHWVPWVWGDDKQDKSLLHDLEHVNSWMNWSKSESTWCLRVLGRQIQKQMGLKTPRVHGLKVDMPISSTTIIKTHTRVICGL